jgi:hypothetical protein
MTQSGHERVDFAAMHCRALALTIGRWAAHRALDHGQRFFYMAGAMT